MRPGRALWLTLLLTLAGVTSATTYRHLELREMASAAELAFSGRVTSVVVEERDGQPWTVVGFEVDEGMRGVAPGELMELAFLGGELPSGTSLRVSLMPSFEVGEEVLVLAYEDRFYSPIVGFRQGLWRLQGSDWLDERGRRLSVGPSGELQRDGAGGDPEAVVEALHELMGEEP